MKVVNPIGRKLDTGADFDVVIQGCICSSGQYSLSVGYSCADCACQCDYGTTNRDANFSIARNSRNYVN